MGKPYRVRGHFVCNLLRGGAWGNFVDYVRSAYRNLSYPGDWYVYFGVRCVRSKRSWPSGRGSAAMGAKLPVRNRVCNHKKSSYGFSQVPLRVDRQRCAPGG
jgi:hypothetical protein